MGTNVTARVASLSQTVLATSATSLFVPMEALA